MRRLFVCDPVCVKFVGHNLFCLDLFRRHFARHFDSTIALGSHFLPPVIAGQYGIVPFFDYYYEQYMPLERGDCGQPSFAESELSRFDDPLEALASRDAAALLLRYAVKATDTIMFPSVDFYGAVGLLNAIQSWPAAMRPSLLFRFLGVVEFGSTFYPDPLHELISRIKRARQVGVSLRMAAENPNLADRLARLCGEPPFLCPYPEFQKFSPMARDGAFVVLCAGSPRPDKGFGILADIIRRVRARADSGKIRFVLQSPDQDEPLFSETYRQELQSLLGVELLPSSLTEAEMMEQYRRSHLLLLPYDVDIYRDRGSGVMMEGANIGRPIITFEGTGFARQIKDYGLGWVATTIDGLVDGILAVSGQPRPQLERAIVKARTRYLRDAEAGCRAWMSGIAGISLAWNWTERFRTWSGLNRLRD